jgi:hypothetical protein
MYSMKSKSLWLCIPCNGLGLRVPIVYRKRDEGGANDLTGEKARQKTTLVALFYSSMEECHVLSRSFYSQRGTEVLQGTYFALL